MSGERERILIVPSFPTIEAVQDAQRAKREQLEASLYPRDGSPVLFQLERDTAEMLGVSEGSLLLYNTGMSAVIDALEIMRPTAETRILKGNQHYSQAGNYITDELRSRGAIIYETDPGSLESVNKALERQNPDVVFFETVTNGSEMATLGVEAFLNSPVLQDVDPLIILDNTLPSSTGMPLGSIISSSARRIIVVESGTKFIGLNAEMCGIAFTNNPDLLLRLRKRRQRTGSLLSVSAIETISSCMPKTAKEYDFRNQAIFKHTLRLAIACSASPSSEDRFFVVHPNLPGHPNHQQANAYSPDGISPVFFIQPADLGDSHYQIAASLWQNPVIAALCDLGQSFGFDRTRIWPDDNSPVVRISGGIYPEKEQAQLDEAFYEVLSNLFDKEPVI